MRTGDPLKGGRTNVSSTPEYVAWLNMRTRCNPTSRRYRQWYAAKGVTVCIQWQHDFSTFLDHVGKRPSPKHSLDRIDNSMGYEPGNVRWTTQDVQGFNQKLRCTNTTGYRGVSIGYGGKFYAQTTYMNRHYNLGMFDTAEEAYNAYVEKSRELRGSLTDDVLV